MLIDWFTVGAQVLNFAILVWLLKHFLYQPILDAIDAREKRIAAELADANGQKAEAQASSEEFKRKNEDFDRQRADLLGKAVKEAEGERQRLLLEARQAADALGASRREELTRDAHNLKQAVGRRIQEEVFAVTRKALSDLASVGLEERMAEVFTRRLRELGADGKAALAGSLKSAAGPVLVRSAFDLPDGQRLAIQNALNETFSADIRVRFETAPELVSGIELTANGQKVAWSIADYLATAENHVGDLLAKNDKPDAEAVSESTAKTASKPVVGPESGATVDAQCVAINGARTDREPGKLRLAANIS